MRPGSLVVFNDSANENTPGWKKTHKVGMIVEHERRHGKDWTWVDFSGTLICAFTRDLIEIPGCSL